MKIISVLLLAALSFSTMFSIAQAADMPEVSLTDGVYVAKVARVTSGNCAWLQIRNGQPVKYMFGSGCSKAGVKDMVYRATSVSMQGNVVAIDQANYIIAAANSNTIEGNFVFDGTDYRVFKKQ